jgi:hypothetical protein
MRLRVTTLVLLAGLLASTRPALAADAGEDGGTSKEASIETGCGDAGADDAGVCCDQGGACGAGEASAPMIACDGALCDTLQGRPEFSCAVAARSQAAGGACAGLVAAVGVLALGVVRRGARRGASRPTSGGGAC